MKRFQQGSSTVLRSKTYISMEQKLQIFTILRGWRHSLLTQNPEAGGGSWKVGFPRVQGLKVSHGRWGTSPWNGGWWKHFPSEGGSWENQRYNLQILGYLKEDGHVKYFRCGLTEESLVFGFMMRLPIPSKPKIEQVIVLQLLLYKVYWIHYPLSLLSICPGFSWPQIICS